MKYFIDLEAKIVHIKVGKRLRIVQKVEQQPLDQLKVGDVMPYYILEPVEIDGLDVFIHPALTIDELILGLERLKKILVKKQATEKENLVTNSEEMKHGGLQHYLQRTANKLKKTKYKLEYGIILDVLFIQIIDENNLTRIRRETVISQDRPFFYAKAENMISEINEFINAQIVN